MGRRQPVASPTMIRRILSSLLLLGPAVVVANLLGAPELVVFVLAAVALIPLAWIIGEATEHASHHTGPGIGGFLNASFGNAPELIIALLAVNNGLVDVVRGSLTGSVVSNLLLVFGVSMVAGGRGSVDKVSSLVSLGLAGLATALFVWPSVASRNGDPERHSLAVVSLSIAIVLLVLYLAVMIVALRRHHRMHVSDESEDFAGWSLQRSLTALFAATVVTAFVAEALVGTLETFSERAGISQFFVAAVIVAIVGNAAEHGGAVVVAARGQMELAAEIALSSAAQVAVLVIPAVVLGSFALTPLPLSFRPIEIGALGGSVILTAAVLHGGNTSRLKGAILILAYVAVAVAFFLAGDR